jgi:two-component system cell cycle response regulator DivK
MTKRILVVEDQEDNRQILRDLLLSSGYEILEAGTACRRSSKPQSIGQT